MKVNFYGFEQMRLTHLADASRATALAFKVRLTQLLHLASDASHATEMTFSGAFHVNVYRYSHRHSHSIAYLPITGYESECQLCAVCLMFSVKTKGVT